MPGPRPLELLTFDIDDTLYSTTDFVRLARENSVKAMIAAGLKAELGEALAELEEIVEEFTSNHERHFDRLLQRLPHACRDQVNPAILVAAGVAAYHDTVVRNLAAYEDVLEVLRTLKEKKYRLGIITQGIEVKQAEKLVRLRILPFLEKKAIFLTDQMGMSKSNPKFFLRVAQVLDLPCERCLHVGDRPSSDIDPARLAGWWTVLNRRSGRHHERPGKTQPHFGIHNFWDLLEILDKEFHPA